MDEVWERAVETALDGQTDCASARSLTLDGAVKCVQGRLPPPILLEKFQNLEHLSIANIGVSSLEKFPRLPSLQRLILSDNRIAGGLEFLVEAGLESLRDLDLSNNRIQYLEELAPLAQLRLVSLDLYECPVTRVKDYRSRVFGLIKSIKYLDKMDADENERPESDEEDEDEEDDDEDDPGSGEIDGEDRSGKMSNGGNGIVGDEAILDVDEDEESDADEEETEISRVVNGFHGASHHHSNGFRVEVSTAGNGDDEDVEDEDDDDLGEEIDEEEGEEEDVVEVHEIEESDDEEDGVEEDDDDDEDEEEEVEDEEEYEEPGSTGRLASTEGEIDGHEQGEEDENGEIGEEEEQDVEEDGEYEEDEGEDEDEDHGEDYRVRPIGQVEEDAGGSDLDPGNEEDGVEEEVEDEEDGHVEVQVQPSSSYQLKRKREEDDDDSVEDAKSFKHQ